MSEDRRKTLRDIFDELDRSFEEMERGVEEAVRNTLSSGRKALSKPFVTGLTMGIGPDGKPSIQFFGNEPFSGNGYRSPIREQFVDEKANTLRLIIELPGVEKEDIEVGSTGDRVSIKAERDSRKYKSEFNLRREVDPESGKAEYKNGILDIVYNFKDKTNKGYRRITVV
jgi:HSP20 family protein